MPNRLVKLDDTHFAVSSRLDSLWKLDSFDIGMNHWKSNTKGKPGITRITQSHTPLLGQKVSLEVQVSGNGAMHYQWRKNNSPISGATSPILAIPAFSLTDAGTYSVEVTNDDGSTLSENCLISLPTHGIEKFQPGNLLIYNPTKLWECTTGGQIVQRIELPPAAEGYNTHVSLAAANANGDVAVTANYNSITSRLLVYRSLSNTWQVYDIPLQFYGNLMNFVGNTVSLGRGTFDLNNKRLRYFPGRFICNADNRVIITSSQYRPLDSMEMRTPEGERLLTTPLNVGNSYSAAYSKGKLVLGTERLTVYDLKNHSSFKTPYTSGTYFNLNFLTDSKLIYNNLPGLKTYDLVTRETQSLPVHPEISYMAGFCLIRGQEAESWLPYSITENTAKFYSYLDYYLDSTPIQPKGDRDKDGISNWDEYLLGTDIFVKNSPGPVMRQYDTEVDWEFSSTGSAPFEYSSDLITWSRTLPAGMVTFQEPGNWQKLHIRAPKASLNKVFIRRVLEVAPDSN